MVFWGKVEVEPENVHPREDVKHFAELKEAQDYLNQNK